MIIGEHINVSPILLFIVFQLITLFAIILFIDQIEIIVLSVFIFASFITLYNPKLILYILYSSIWVSQNIFIDIYGVIIRITDLIIFFLTISWLLRSTIDKHLIISKPNRNDYPLILLMILAVISFFTTQNKLITFLEIIQISELIFVYYLVKTFIKDGKDFYAFMLFTVVYGLIDSFWISSQVVIGNLGLRKIALFEGTGDELAYSILFLYLFLLKEKIPYKKFGIFFITVFIMFSMMFTLGRGLLIITCVMLLVSTFIFFVKRKQYLYLSLTSLFAIFTVLIMMSTISGKVIDRYSSITQDDPTRNVRLYNWYSSLTIINKYPFTGVGLGNGTKSLKDNMPEWASSLAKKYGGNTPHNELLHFGIETGLLGIVFAIIFYFFLFMNGLKLVSIEREKGEKIIDIAIFSVVCGLILWIFANDVLLAGKGVFVMVILAFINKLSSSNKKLMPINYES